MSVTAGIDMINLQVYAQKEMAAAIADGSYAARRKADRKAFIWQSRYQTIPIGTETDPVGYARALRQALPLVNTLRIPFNFYSFNPDGTLDERFEAFLDEAARQGFKLLFVYMDGEGQRYGTRGVPGSEHATAEEIAAALQGEVLDRARASFGRLLDWLGRHPGVKAKTWGLELMNEPAAFKTGMQRVAKTDVAGRARFVALYAKVMVALAKSVQERWHGPILVGGFAYSARFNILARTRMPSEPITALDYIRKGVGSDLVWSAHLYPNWVPHSKTRARFAYALDGKYRVLGRDNILLTETNGPEGRTYNLMNRADRGEIFAQNYEWFADHGIGLGWFTGSQKGNSSFVTFIPGKPLLFENLDSYGAGMNAFTLGDPPGPATGETLVAGFIPGTVKLKKSTAAVMLRHSWTNAAHGIAVAAGHAGDDTIMGISEADNFLYGRAGGDSITGAGPNDYLYGQDGNDTITNPGGDDHIFGGRGNDLIVSLGGYSELWGGPGGDRFSLGTAGKSIIVDYEPKEGDTADFRGHYRSLAGVIKHLSIIDYDGNGIPDLMVWHGTGYAIFLDMGDRIPEFLRSLAEFHPPETLPPQPADPITGTPFSPKTGFNPDGPPLSPRPEPPAGALPPGPGKAIRARSAPTFGTAGNDTIEGRGDDVIVAGPGDDLVRERRGNATIFGGAGDDTIETGRRASKIVTGPGDDLIEIDMRNHGPEIWAGPGHDTFAITAIGQARRGRFAVAQIHGFDPARDTIRIGTQTVDLGHLGPGMVLTRFARGQVLVIDDFARLYLYEAKRPATDAAERAFDPEFDPGDPARHLR